MGMLLHRHDAEKKAAETVKREAEKPAPKRGGKTVKK